MAEAKCDREEGDGGDGKSMSLDEFKHEMFRSLRDTGTVEMIRAQLRRKFIEKLQQHGAKDRSASLDTGEDRQYNNTIENNSAVINATVSANCKQWSGDEKLVNGLLFDYFAKKGLEHSAAVFVPEIGGAKNFVAVDTILQDTQVLTKPLVVLLLHELSRHLSTHTMDSGTQTALDYHDHRFALENQLRRVETAYLTECENQKQQPAKSLEERMLQYQSEYDALSEKRVQEELERFKSLELSLMRVEERKKYEREADTLRGSLLQEQRQKSERLQERERDLELAFVAKRTELETSLFETRQSLFQEMEKLRVKQAQLQVKVESDFRHFTAETKRLQLWEETVSVQEKNMERVVSQAIREKEYELQLECSKANHSFKVREDELVEREALVECGKEAVRSDKLKHKALMDDLARLEESFQTMEQAWKDASKTIVKLEKEKKRLQDEMDAKEADTEREKGSLAHLNTLNARLVAEKELLQQEIERYRVLGSENDILIKQLTFELKESQQLLLAIKMDEANALVGERKKFLKALDDDREQFQWKENELLVKLREFQSRLAESEAAMEKFQSQYEDEKLHVESLRQEVGNLNALLSQAQATINAKHGTVALHRSARAGTGGSSDIGAVGSGDFSSDRLLMIKMMEMMARFQSGPQFTQQQYHEPAATQYQSRADGMPVSYPPAYASQSQLEPGATMPPEPQVLETDEDDKRLKYEQLRIERELLEQREYERKKAERMDQEEREIAERKRLFDEEMACQRQARLEEDEHLETERRRKLGEEEQKIQIELEKQRKTLQEASDLQQRLAEERVAVVEKQRLQDEQAYQERMRADNSRLEQELEVKRLKRQQKEEEESEAEKRRKEDEAREFQQREAEAEEQEKVKRERERQREQAEAEAAQRESAEKELRRQKDQEILETQERQAEEKEERERTADTHLHEVQEERKLEDEVRVQEAHDPAPPVLVTDLLEPGLTEETWPMTESVQEYKQIALDNDVSAGFESTFPAEESCELVDIHDTSESAKEPIVELEGSTTTASALVEEKPRELTEEEQLQAAEEEKKTQADATMDVYRQRVLARKAAEKQKQLELEAEAAHKRQEEEVERRRQDEQANGDSEQELELSGGSFAESRRIHKEGQLVMTLDFEVRATRRPLPRQLEVSDWTSSEASKVCATGNSSSASRTAALSSVACSPHSRYSTGGAFPPSYSVRMPVNRYDTPPMVNNQDEWRYSNTTTGPTTRSSYASASSPSTGDCSLSSGHFSSFSMATSGDYKLREERQKRDSWDSSSAASASSDYRRLSSYSRQTPSRDDDNQRDERRETYSGRRDSFVDVSPLRYQRDEMKSSESTSRGGHYTKEYAFEASSKPLASPPRGGNRMARDVTSERPFFSPFRTTESTKSASPDSKAASEDSDAKSLFYQFSSKLGMDNDDSDSESEAKSHSSFKPSSQVATDEPSYDGDMTVRRALFRPPSTPSVHSDDQEKSTRTTFSPSSSLSTSELLREAQTNESRVRTEPTRAAPYQPPADPIASMAERREELYSFRKKMREAFARVDEMVDAHRELFKSDPGSGTPLFDLEAAQEAERLADAVFADLAGLREQFRELATDFKDSEAKDSAARMAKTGVKTASTISYKVREPQSIVTSGNDNVDSYGDDSVTTPNVSALESFRSQRKSMSSVSTRSDNVDEATSSAQYLSSSMSSPTFSSSHLHSSHVDEAEGDGDLTRSTVFSEEDHIDADDAVSASMNDNFLELSTNMASRIAFPRYPSSSLQSKSSGSTSTSRKGDSPEDGNMFKDFDQRMEEIRASLHSIARGRKQEAASGERQGALSQRATRGTSHEMAALSSRVGKSSEKILPDQAHEEGSGGDDDPLSCRDDNNESAQHLRELLRKLQSENGRGSR